MSDSLRPHELQHARLPRPSPSPGVCANSCPLSWWCHPTFSSSVIPFSSCPQSLPESGSFPMTWLFFIRWPKYWNFSISPSNEYSGLISFRTDCFDLFAVQGTLKSLLQHHSSKASALRWDLSSLTRDWTLSLALEAWSLNHRTTKGFPFLCFWVKIIILLQLYL